MKQADEPSTEILDHPSASSAPWRRSLAAWIESPPVQWTIVGVIAFNAGVLGLETTQWGRGPGHGALVVLDVACLAIFVVEIALKLVAVGPRFFRSGWNVFDFVIIAIALFPASGSMSALRALRALRILRLISAFPQLRRVVSAVFAAIPGMLSILAILVLVLYISAIMANNLFGDTFPQWFGSLPRTLLTLFQVMTFDSWSSGILRTVMTEYPLAWLFFVPYVAVSAFTMVNLFVAVMVDSMQMLNARGADDSQAGLSGAAGVAEDPASASQVAQLTRDIAALQSSIAILHARLDSVGVPLTSDDALP